MSRNGKKFAVVTGASSGIGRAIARCFAADGYSLVIAADDRKGLDTAAQVLKAAGAPKVVKVVVDLATPKGPKKLYDAVKKKRIKGDFLVNNAGVGVFGEFLKTDLDKELRSIQLNVIAVTALTKMFAKDMARRRRGKILITSSLVAFASAPNLAVYSATKAFDASLAQALANEFETKGITVTALMPDATDTDFFRKAKMLKTKIAKGKKADPNDIARAGYDAMMRGKDHVAAPFAAKVTAALTRVLPADFASEQARAR